MKNSAIWLLCIVVIVIGLVWLNKQGSQTASVQQATSFAVVSDEVARGAKLYDVRTAQEFSEGHFAHATNWSLQDIQAGKLPDVPKDTRIYLYCRSGNARAIARTTTESIAIVYKL